MSDYKQHPLYHPSDFDGIFSGSWQMYKKHFLLLFIYGFLFSLLLSLPGTIMNYQEMLTKAMEQPEVFLSEYSGKFGILLLFSLLGYTALVLVQTYFVIYREIEPGKSQLGHLGTAFAHYYPSLLIVFLMAGVILVFGTSAGVLALFIGALVALVYFGTVFFPLAPIVLAENKDPFTSLGRTFVLVHRYFWPTVGQVVVFALLYLVVTIILSMIVSLPDVREIFSAMKDHAQAEEMVTGGKWLSSFVNPVQLILQSLVSGVISPFVATTSVSIYFNLKAREDKATGK
jgi:hypothetical protein